MEYSSGTIVLLMLNAKIKARANVECNTTKVISTLQALIALIWRCVTRIRCLPLDQISNCRMSIDIRSRLYPPLSQNYFGNTVQIIGGMTAAGELLAHEFGWVAWLLNQALVQHYDNAVQSLLDRGCKVQIDQDSHRQRIINWIDGARQL